MASSPTILTHNPIFKVYNLIGDNEIDKIIVFYGFHESHDQLNELFVSDPTNKLFIDPSTGEPIFAQSELDEIAKHHTMKKDIVEFVGYQLHIDDSIEQVKLKIAKTLSNQISLLEMYLFCNVKETYDASFVYEMLTQNNKIPLTIASLNNFLSNIKMDDDMQPVDLRIHVESTSDAKKYGYDDVLELNLSNSSYIVNKSIGQKLMMLATEHPFVVNPFHKGHLVDVGAKQKITTFDSNLLLDTSTIINNTIYLCLAENVLSDQLGEKIIKMYYPGLFDLNITSKDELDEKKQELIERTNGLLGNKAEIGFKSVDMFYDVYKMRTKELNYKKSGVKFIKFAMHPPRKIRFPLDIIFKIIHANESNPLIKCNYNKKQENVYRLFANNTSTDGRKIPHLSLAAVNTLGRNIAKYPSVAVYIECIRENKMQKIVCTFEENGDIIIEAAFDDVVMIDEIDKIFVEHVNPIISEVKMFFEQSGYMIDLFNSVLNEHVEIIQMSYNFEIVIDRKMKISNFIGCVSSAFNVENDTFEKNKLISLRFKRVSNFNKLTSQDALIVEKMNQEMPLSEIIVLLSQNFNISEEEAEKIVTNFLSEKQIEVGVGKNITKVRINPGFETIIAFNSNTKIINIEVNNIDNIRYLQTVPIYIDTLVRITQDTPNVRSTKYPAPLMNELCFGTTPEEIEETGSDAETPEEVVPVKETVYVAAPSRKKSVFISAEDSGEESEEDEGASSSDQRGGEDSSSSVSSASKKGDDSSVSSASKKGDDIIVASSSSSSLSSPERVDEASSDSESDSESESDESDAESEKTPETPPLPEKEPSPQVLAVPAPAELEKEKEPSPQVLVVPAPAELEKEKEKEKEKAPSPQVLAVPPEPEKPLRKKKPQQLKLNPITIKEDENILDISKMQLSNPSFLETRMAERDKTLFNGKEVFVHETKGNFKSYSRICASNYKLQPISLTKEELLNIKNTNGSALSGKFDENDEYSGVDVLKYGADPKNPSYYMCPQYWCLTKNIPLTQEQVNEGKICGGKDKIIPWEDSTPGKNTIFQFFHKDKHVGPKGPDGKPIYKQYYPGFNNTYKTTQGFCAPCCFSNYNTPSHEARKKECLGTNDSADKNDKNEKEIGPEKTVKEEYIKGPENFPLGASRWGYLPMAIQMFFQSENLNLNCASDGNIKKNAQCLLRYGVEKSLSQSFIACLSTTKYFGKEIKSIERFKQEDIIDELKLDKFLKYQNGNLMNDFAKNDQELDLNNDEIAEIYKTSELYAKMRKDPENLHQEAFLKRAVQSFINFKEYLKDNDVYIDHTHLWDIVCEKNPKVFKYGLNLVILKIVDNDITNNVEILCPTNQYSNEKYNSAKDTLMLILRDGIFEPIYLYKDKSNSSEKNFEIFNVFNVARNTQLRDLRGFFDLVVSPVMNMCTPLPSLPKEYVFKSPIRLDVLVNRLKELSYTIIHQVLNYQGKVIGLVASSKSNETGFVPCYPSALITGDTIDYVFMDDDAKIWRTYKETLSFLRNLNRFPTKTKLISTKIKIPCKPIKRIIDNGVVVGVLTETNQFVKINDPFLKINETNADSNIMDMEDIEDNNFFLGESVDENGEINMNRLDVDTYVLNNRTIDTERVAYIKKIKLETNFYNMFRNSIRTFLNEPKNRKIRKDLKELLDTRIILYDAKLTQTIAFLHKLVGDRIQFSDTFDYDFLNKIIKNNMLRNGIEFSEDADYNFENAINKMSDCINNNSSVCNKSYPEFCKDESSCALFLPKFNLLKNKNMGDDKGDAGNDDSDTNEHMYYAKIADELIRFNRIKEFFFQSQTYVAFNSLGYNLNNNEIILLESLIPDYYKNLVPVAVNKYAQNNNYDSVEPIKSQTYDNYDKTDNELYRSITTNECSTGKILKPIASSIWKNCFPGNYNEITFGSNAYCSYQMIIDVLRTFGHNNVTNEYDIKHVLTKEYNRYMKMHEMEFNANYFKINKINPQTLAKKEIQEKFGEQFDQAQSEEFELFQNKIVDILIFQGKKTRGDSVKSQKIGFLTFVELPDYYLTNLDLWIIFNYFKIPSILISNSCLFEQKYAERQFVLYANEADLIRDKYVFIVSPGYKKKGEIPQYKLITNNSENNVTKNIHIGINDLTDETCKQQLINALRSRVQIYDFLNSYVPLLKSEHSTKKCMEKRETNKTTAPKLPKNELDSSPLTPQSLPKDESPKTPSHPTPSPPVQEDVKTRLPRCPDGHSRNKKTLKCDPTMRANKTKRNK